MKWVMMLHADNGPDDQSPDARLAHELSNLLDGSLRHVSLALAKLNDASGETASADTQTVDNLRTAGDAMRQMAELLQGWTRNQQGMPTNADITLAQSIDQIVRLLRPQADQQGITMRAKLDDAVKDVQAASLGAVVNNALRNAIESIGRGGSIEITGCCDGENIELRIADNGPGVALMVPRDDDGLVQPGFTTKEGGHGLGLAISRDIMRAMGGTIRLVDRPTGGAVLIVRWTPSVNKANCDD